MPGEFFFMAIGGLGVSLAGFAGIIAALDKGPSSPVSVWRIRQIVEGGFILAFGGFLTIALYTVTGESLSSTVRLTSLFGAVVNGVHVGLAQRPGPAWPNERGRRMAMAASWTVIGVTAFNVIAGRLGLLQILFIAQLGDPASIFINAVRDIARGDQRPSEAQEETRGGGDRFSTTEPTST